MESIYWVLTWACHRKCVHCYDDRFRPYVRDELKAVIGEGQAAWPKVIENLPRQMAFEDPKDATKQKIGRIILAGGEVLHKPVREALFYPVLEALQKRYTPAQAKISIQTTGDILTAKMIKEMLERGVHTIAISGMDDYHVGMEGDKRLPLMAKIRAMMAKAGVSEISLAGKRMDGVRVDFTQEDGPYFLFFGAQPARLPMAISAPISAPASLVARTSSITPKPAARLLSSLMAMSIPAASRPKRLSAISHVSRSFRCWTIWQANQRYKPSIWGILPAWVSVKAGT
jgi:hypothetical protein